MPHERGQAWKTREATTSVMGSLPTYSRLHCAHERKPAATTAKCDARVAFGGPRPKGACTPPVCVFPGLPEAALLLASQSLATATATENRM